MMQKPKRAFGLLSCCLLLAILGAPAARGQGADTIFDGTFTLKANGDMTAVLKFTMPMVHYQELKENISNLYLLLRNAASARADTEVVEKKAEWDDANRTVTFTMTTLGAAKNMGGHWEVQVAKGAMFTTFNEKENTFYFSEAAGTPKGNVRGTTKGILPPGARNAKWDEGRRVITYELPAPKPLGRANMGLVIPGAALAAIGLVLVIGAFFASPKQAMASAVAPQASHNHTPPPLPGR